MESSAAIAKDRVQNRFPILYQHEARASEFGVFTRSRFVLVSGTYFRHVPKDWDRKSLSRRMVATIGLMINQLFDSIRPGDCRNRVPKWRTATNRRSRLSNGRLSSEPTNHAAKNSLRRDPRTQHRLKDGTEMRPALAAER